MLLDMRHPQVPADPHDSSQGLLHSPLHAYLRSQTTESGCLQSSSGWTAASNMHLAFTLYLKI